METTFVQSVKLAIMANTGLGRDALHIYFGLTALIISVLVLRKSIKSFVPWLVVFALAIAGELLDMRDDLASRGHWRWSASLHDIWNTLFWPTVILILARRKLVFGAE